jgi:two-component system sensor histidine kinase KdpD
VSSESPARGRIKIFLGYAAGVGKTYRMLEEAQAAKRDGVDVVIGYFEPHKRADTIAKAEGLEIVPRRIVEYRGAKFEEMDTAAILGRRPALAVVDELAHTNVPGSERPKRWQDVVALLEAGIDVFTTMNIQHIESLNDQILEISGVRVRETIPDWIVTQANEVVMVDATVEALLNRMRRGVVYEPEKAHRALENFFKESTLGALRELALRQTAHQVELLQERTNRDEASSAPTAGVPTSRDRLLVHVTGDPATAVLIRRARRLADFLRADCFAVYVTVGGDLRALPAPEREAIVKHLDFARNLRIQARVIQGKEVVESLVDFARTHKVTQILLSRGDNPRWKEMLGETLVFQIVRLAREMRVTVVAKHRRSRALVPPET